MSIEVTTWAEFVEAVGTPGAEVSLPENAVWDMNEILPHFNQNLSISCSSIAGNGTEIKNLHITGYFAFSSTPEIQDLSLTNIFADGVGGGSDAGTKSFFYYAASGEAAFRNCTVSGIFGSYYNCIFGATNYDYPIEIEQCAFNMDMDGGTGIQRVGGHRKHACRWVLNFPHTNQVWLTGAYTDSFNEFVINAPLALKIWAYSQNSSTYRGNMQNVTEIYPEGMTDVSVYSTASLPNAVIQGWVDVKLQGVTDAQMKSADYLRGIGFLIGVD